MPYELAMADELSRHQYYQTARAHIDALTEERDRLKQWQADQVEVNEEAKALITELNADKKALEAERDQLVKERDEFKRLFEECGIARDCSGFLGTVPDCIEYLDAERDRLALANAELLVGLTSVLQACDGGRMVARGVGGMTIDAQIRRSVINGVPAWPIEEARALLDKHKATSTEREGE